MKMTVSIVIRTGRKTSHGYVRVFCTKEYEVNQAYNLGIDLRVDFLSTSGQIYRKIERVLVDLDKTDYIVELESYDQLYLTTVEMVKNLKDVAKEHGWQTEELYY